jgi:hypothetical protein
MRRKAIAVVGMRTAKIWSQALEEAIRWLTGQMPQVGGQGGHFTKWRPDNFSNPRTWVTCTWAS